MSNIDRVLAAVAAENHSVITRADLVAVRGNNHHAETRLAAGRWIEVYEGVWRLAGAPWTWEGIVFAAVKAAGDGAMASHQCAARLLDIGFKRAKPELSVPRGRNFRPRDVIVHTSTDLGRCQSVLRRGIPATDPARTILDLGRYIRGTNLVNAIQDARRLELVDWPDLAACLVTHARRGRSGIARLREAIAFGAVNDGITDTMSELIALSLLREHNFEEPTLKHRIYAPGRLVAEMDFAWLDRRINIEIDGNVHLRPEVKVKDEARDHELRTVYGYTVRRIWWEIPVHKPREFVAIVRDTLR